MKYSQIQDVPIDPVYHIQVYLEKSVSIRLPEELTIFAQKIAKMC